MKNQENIDTQRGVSIIGVFILIIIVIFALHYFHVSIKVASQNATVQKNINYITKEEQKAWSEYIDRPLMHVWNDLWLPIWSPFIANIKGSVSKVNK